MDLPRLQGNRGHWETYETYLKNYCATGDCLTRVRGAAVNGPRRREYDDYASCPPQVRAI